MSLRVSSDTGKGGRYRRLLVCLRARQIWREKGQRQGNDMEDWNQAEHEYENQHFAMIARVIWNVPEHVLKSLDLYLKLLVLPITVIALLNYIETTKQDRFKLYLSYADRYEQDSFMNIREALN